MPELPEVEIAARSLAPQVEGRTIVALERLTWERMVETPDHERFRMLVVGREFRRVYRRAKWVLLELDAGWTLAIHLRMSGHLIVQGPGVEVRHHVHLILQLSDGGRLCFDDERKFGRVRLLDAAGLAALDAAHGPEPLAESFTPAVLASILAKRSTRLKSLLLDQRRIAGLGNIYVSEALWLARLHPRLPAEQVDFQGVTALHSAIRTVLQQAIAHEGSSLRNYRNSYGRRGQNQEHFLVYDRAGQPCSRCGCPIERTVIAQRSSFVCPTCQGA
ncbi:bifunctional DNA-formamidopyrimidine glycosylase/DNA-(apurinic or apyrimidinic site) lyase [Candidatus Viridilinea mediisalina]|uniref:DNA-formamidopyrimidine glycosylase n=1 Tax=Candidatus Viridilinea mediisalina TaxID=2024553 RepID=A0A2A6RLY2_9CHLR|nr:bifunctional DNA-formamidopyrimidine glycosylase/DNA-(apurinic or apyrimidinic site) lyase [Candidatus Viridilinea mediisalina]PDW03935.1 DNA-formamidopyrimidine glycosylase [Candidatus Viridilinea mediisalina]